MIIKVEPIDFDKEIIEKRLERLDPDRMYRVQRLVFYPYVFFEYALDEDNYFHPLKGHIGCTIDGVNKVGALVDTFPQLMEQNIPEQDIIQTDLKLVHAKEMAEEFLYQSITAKKKVLTVPKLAMTKQELFYRPYWIVKVNLNHPDCFLITVDAISGKMHPLN